MSDVRHFAGPNEAFAHEDALLDRVTRGAAPFACCFWTTEQALVVPRATECRPIFADVAAASAKRGWPVFVRRTGGGVSPQGSGILNATVAFACNSAAPSITLVYERFCAPIVRLLADLGIAAATGSVPGSFCDGAFNVTVGDRKFAGTAQRWRSLGRDRGSAVLAHAVMLIDPPMAGVVRAVDALHRELGEAHRVLLERHVALAELRPLAAPAGLDVSDLADGLERAFRDSLRPFGPDPAGPTTANHAGARSASTCADAVDVRHEAA